MLLRFGWSPERHELKYSIVILFGTAGKILLHWRRQYSAAGDGVYADAGASGLSHSTNVLAHRVNVLRKCKAAGTLALLSKMTGFDGPLGAQAPMRVLSPRRLDSSSTNSLGNRLLDLPL